MNAITGSQAHRLTGSQAHRLTGSQAHRLTGSQAHRLTGSQAHADYVIGRVFCQALKLAFSHFCEKAFYVEFSELFLERN